MTVILSENRWYVSIFTGIKLKAYSENTNLSLVFVGIFGKLLEILELQNSPTFGKLAKTRQR